MRKKCIKTGATLLLAVLLGVFAAPVSRSDERLYTSPVMRGMQPARKIDLSIAGVNFLHLIVETARDGENNDYADWAEAKLKDRKGRETPLAELDPVYVDQGWLTLQRNHAVDGGPLRIGDLAFTSGLGTHAYAHLVYRLDGGYEWFSSFVGVDGSQGQRGSVVFVVASSRRFKNPMVIPTPHDVKWWYELADGYTKLAANAPRIDLVFLGDSITQSWAVEGKEVWRARFAPRHAVNFGIGGDRTENVLWRIKYGNFSGVIAQRNPKAVVLMIGTNNSGCADFGLIAEGVKADIDAIREKAPQSRILLLGIFPRGERPDDPQRVIVQNVNGILKTYADDQKVFYLDIGDAFMEKDGTISRRVMPDFLHLSPEGFRIWADRIEPTLAALAPES